MNFQIIKYQTNLVLFWIFGVKQFKEFYVFLAAVFIPYKRNGFCSFGK